ncbi:uncharacterized protein LOC100904498 [Galendromus occidentalis]|uniref:Uncharacterized protein LOC100904498 n=1 Tax=Galendromus occidentalis TaxID=34638 RepID=A0AAJ7PB66_9ACAR|nr:uncharacterized protein LOC100904498 [Galendromus occidentalis]XP_018497560.1 uncharacterized protein LOC100904498 [Galendromus occidentalis]
MLLRVITCTALVGTALGDSAANMMMDRILKDLWTEIEHAGLQPTALSPFNLRVKASDDTQKDFKANFTQGSLHGLRLLERHGNCEHGFFRVACYVSLGSLRAVVNADVEGDLNGEKPHSISISSKVHQSFLRIKFYGGKGSPAQLIPLTVGPIDLVSKVEQGKIDIERRRFYDFEEQTERNVARQISSILSGRFSAVLHTVASRHLMP